MAPTRVGSCDFFESYFCHQSGRHWPDSGDTPAFESRPPGPHFGPIPGPSGAPKSPETGQTPFGKIQKCLKHMEPTIQTRGFTAAWTSSRPTGTLRSAVHGSRSAPPPGGGQHQPNMQPATCTGGFAFILPCLGSSFLCFSCFLLGGAWGQERARNPVKL